MPLWHGMTGTRIEFLEETRQKLIRSMGCGEQNPVRDGIGILLGGKKDVPRPSRQPTSFAPIIRCQNRVTRIEGKDSFPFVLHLQKFQRGKSLDRIVLISNDDDPIFLR